MWSVQQVFQTAGTNKPTCAAVYVRLLLKYTGPHNKSEASIFKNQVRHTIQCEQNAAIDLRANCTLTTSAAVADNTMNPLVQTASGISQAKQATTLPCHH
jgi:hypothetical protein